MSGYLGNQPVPQATQTRDAFTATAGQTSFATRGYTPNFLDVFLNGVKLAAADYTATNGSDVVLASGAVVNDILEVVAYTAFDTANVTASSGFTVTGNFSADGGTIKLDGNYPVGANNLGMGNNSLNGSLTGTANIAYGYSTLNSLTSGNYNVAIGGNSQASTTTGSNNISMGFASLDASTTGGSNTALGHYALSANTTASNNTAVGYQAGYSNTTGDKNVTLGGASGYDNTTGRLNTFVGYNSGANNTTANSNTFMGESAGFTNTTGANNTAIGQSALVFNTTASNNTAVGYKSLNSNTTGAQNTAIGLQALDTNTTGESMVAVGYQALDANSTGSFNTAIGREALQANTTASANTAVGYQAGYTNTTGNYNTFVGRQAGYLANNTGNVFNAFFGQSAGYSCTTGYNNTFIGTNAGDVITTGHDNTILGRYNGNTGGLDIRTSSNNIVLSDGDGNVRQYINEDGDVIFPSRDSATSISAIGINTLTIQTTDSGCPVIYSNDDNNVRYRVSFRKNGTTIGSIVTTGSNTAYNTASDHRLKENVSYTWDATTRLKQLKPARFNFIADGTDTVLDGFIAHEAQTVVPESVSGTHNEVDEDGNPEYQGIDHSKLVPLLVKTIQELEARITALEA